MDLRLTSPRGVGEVGTASEYEQYVEEIEFLLRKISIVIFKRGREILKYFDITPPQFNALLVLIGESENRSLTMGELCDKLYLASSTVTDLVDRMEKNGLVEREKDSRDRRVIRLKVKERGHQVLAEVMKARKRYLAEVLLNIPGEDRAHLVQSLRTLYEMIDRQHVGSC